MELLIKKATITDKNSIWNEKQCDVLILNGRIEKIADHIDHPSAKIITSPSLHLSPGWLDLRAFMGEPGFEFKEDLNTGTASAANGGFTAVAVMPSTQPIIDNKGQVEYLKQRTSNNMVDVLPVGALSEELKGDNFNELFDMQQSGAVAFTDDKNSIQKSGLIIRSLEYAKPLDALIMLSPNDYDLSHGGQVNEGVVSTQLGLKGIPAIAEEVMIERDLKLAEYCDHKIHISGISTENSVNIIRNAKANGIEVTCDVSLPNLIWNDTAIETFDPNFKVFPPLRTEGDRIALLEGLKDGTIDVIVSDHRPETIENKFCEFEHAAYGMSTIEVLYSLYNEHLRSFIELPVFLDKICFGPRTILGQKTPNIQEGEVANLTLFDTQAVWKVTAKDLRSKSRNNPVVGTTLSGRVIGIINNNQTSIA